MTYSNLVFSGGALKGCSFIGCLKYLEEQDLITHFKHILGSSSGSIMALFVVLSYNSDEIKTFIENNLYNVFDIKMKDMLQMYKYYGLDDGKRIVKFCEKILEYKNLDKDITFIDLAKLKGKNLIIASANLTNSKIEYFSVDNNGDMCVKDAIRMSVSIPFLFKPVMVDSNYYVDAFIYNNFPIEYFKEELQYTIGIKIKTKISKISSFIDFIGKIFSTMLDKLTLTNNYCDHMNIYEINNSYHGSDYSIKSMKFDIKYEMVHKYIEEGYDQFSKEFSKRNTTSIQE